MCTDMYARKELHQKTMPVYEGMVFFPVSVRSFARQEVMPFHAGMKRIAF